MEQKLFNPDFQGMLNGVRVIDLSRVVAGNMLTLQPVKGLCAEFS